MAAFDPASPHGINTHLPPPAHLDRVAAAGIAWIRVDFKAMAIVTTASGASSD
jgi:hypothetical protein